jgi:hypothetical protein
MANKYQFIGRVLDVMVQMAVLEETISGLAGVYTDRGFQPAGSDAINQADLTAAQSTLTVAQFTDALVVIAEYQTFCKTTATLPAPTPAGTTRKTKLNIARKDI